MLLAAMRRIQLVLDRVDDLEADVLALTIAIQPQHEIRRSFGFLAEMLADINLHDVRFDSVQFDSSQARVHEYRELVDVGLMGAWWRALRDTFGLDSTLRIPAVKRSTGSVFSHD